MTYLLENITVETWTELKLENLESKLVFLIYQPCSNKSMVKPKRLSYSYTCIWVFESNLNNKKSIHIVFICSRILFFI